jgi:hypothetical protein
VWPVWKKCRLGIKIQRVIDIKKEQIFFKEFIMFLNETYLVLAVTSFVNLKVID